MTQPWRDRPDSMLRGYVLGSMIGGWASFGLLIFFAVTLSIVSLAVFSLLYLVLAGCATYMWYHG